MKKFKNLPKFIVAFTVIILMIIFMTFIGNGTTIVHGEDGKSQTNSILRYENYMLRKQYDELLKRVEISESKITTITKYDRYIYSQLLGMDVDSTDIELNNDSIDYNTVDANILLNNLDERTLRTSQLAANELQKFIETSNLIKKNKSILNLYPNVSPIKTIDFIEVSSGFGWRKHPIYHTPLFHDGIDIAANPNTKVYSTINGRVEEVKYSKYGYGNMVVIKNTSGFETLYAHLSKNIYVQKGQVIKKGQIIATTGNTGTSTGPHLHYEIRQNSKLKDPLGYFFTYLTNNYVAVK